LLLYMGVKLGLSREEKTWVEDWRPRIHSSLV
jgi:hypothetical protein